MIRRDCTRRIIVEWPIPSLNATQETSTQQAQPSFQPFFPPAMLHSCRFKEVSSTRRDTRFPPPSPISKRSKDLTERKVYNELVASVERDFSKAVDAWLAQNSDTTPDARERFADHLTQQYMCSVLDALPSTDAVRSVRRRVAAKIELVAAGVRDPAPSPPKKRTAPWHCPACGRTNDPTLSNCAVCQRSAPDGPAVDPALVASIGAMKARSDVKANEIQGLMGDTEAFLKKLRDSRT